MLILILVQDHLSATIIIVLVVGIMMLMAGVRPMYFATVGSATAVAGVAGLYAMAKFTSKGAFRIARITSFLNPWADKQGDGWQVIQSLYAIGSGGLFGVGLGQSKQKYLYICSFGRRVRICWLCNSYCFIWNIYMERCSCSNESSGYVWKFSSSRNYIFNRLTSDNKHSGCNIIYASNWNAITIL